MGDLCALRQALRELQRACTGVSLETGLAGMPALCEALLLMVQAGCDDDTSAAPIAVPAGRPVSPPVSVAKQRQPSQSTASPSSDSSDASSGGFGFDASEF